MTALLSCAAPYNERMGDFMTAEMAFMLFAGMVIGGGIIGMSINQLTNELRKIEQKKLFERRCS
jgi:hypothetical protein